MKQQLMKAINASMILVCMAVITFAQNNSGSITGTVTDANGAVIPNARLDITNLATNNTITVYTDSDGVYHVAGLPPGEYQIVVSIPGFATQRIEKVSVSQGMAQRLDVRLIPGSAVETITVSSELNGNPRQAAIGDIITNQRILNLPINGRDFTKLLATVPGSVQSGNFFQNSLNGLPTWFGQSVLLDGVDIGRGDLNGLSNTYGRIDARLSRTSLEDIQEVQLQEQTYGAQFGQSLGAVINVLSKSSTSEMHGGLFEFFHGAGFDANDYFVNAKGVGRQEFVLHQFGCSLTRKIIEGRLSFFANYEGVRQHAGTLLQGLVPTQLFRTTFNPELAPVLAKIPLPNTALDSSDSKLGLFRKIGIRKLREDTGAFNIEYTPRENDRFAVRYNINDANNVTPYGIAVGQIAPATQRVHLLRLEHTHSFSSATVNDLSIGLNRNVVNLGGGDESIPIFNLSYVDRAIASPGPALFSSFRAATGIQLLDVLGFYRGKHTVQIGADIRLNRRAARQDQQDQLIFLSLPDFANNAPSIAQRIGNPTLGYRNENFSFFVQDDWSLRRNLMLNLGLRYDVSTPSREQYGRLQNFDLQTLTFTPLGARIHHIDSNNLAPRLGLVWDVFGNKRTLLRTGAGIFYNQELPAGFGSPQANTFPDRRVTVLDAPIHFPLMNSDFLSPLHATNIVNLIDPHLPTPYAEQWSLSFEQELWLGGLQVAYVGNHALKLTAGSSIAARTINRINPITGLRPIQSVGDIRVIAGYPQSNYNALQVNFKRNFHRALGFDFNFTWSHEIDDAIGFLKDYQDSNNLRADRASGDIDVRKNVTVDLIYDLSNMAANHLKFLPTKLTKGWKISSIAQYRTGFPVNITIGGGAFDSRAQLRPNLVHGVPTRPANYSLPNNQFNPAAYQDPGLGKFGNLGRNTARGPVFAQVDLSLAKYINLTESKHLSFQVEAFNILNHPNFADPIGELKRDTITNRPSIPTSFGQSVQTVGGQQTGLLGFGGARQMQFALRFIF